LFSRTAAFLRLQEVRVTKIGFAIPLCMFTLCAAAQQDDWGRALERARQQVNVGEFKQAERSLREALKISNNRPEGPSLAVKAVTMNALGLLHDEMGRYREAEKELRQALDAVVARKGAETDHALMLANLAGVFNHQRRFPESEQVYREALEIYAKHASPDDTHYALAKSGLGEVLVNQKRLEEAERLLEQAIPVLVNQPEPHVAIAGLSINNLAVVRLRQGRLPEAAKLLEDAIRWTERECGDGFPRIASPLNNLAMTYARLNRVDDASATFARALKISAKGLGADHPLHALIQANYASFLRKTGHKAESKAIEAKSREILRQSDRQNGIGMTVDASTFRMR